MLTQENISVNGLTVFEVMCSFWLMSQGDKFIITLKNEKVMTPVCDVINLNSFLSIFHEILTTLRLLFVGNKDQMKIKI